MSSPNVFARIPWAYTVRRLVYNIPVYMGVILLVMACLRVNDPVYSFLGKNASQLQYDKFAEKAGLDKPFVVQYFTFLTKVVTANFVNDDSWDKPGQSVGELVRMSIWPSLAITVPALILTSMISVAIGLLSAFNRGNLLDKSVVVVAVLGMSVSFLVYIILGQYFGAFIPNREYGYDIFAVSGYEPMFPNGLSSVGDIGYAISNWCYYCLLPVMISVVVAMGYDTRFYRAVMVEETGKDYIVTAQAKGASQAKIMFVHMLMNAMIPIITRIMTTVPFLITGSLLLEVFFRIPGMGRQLILAIGAKDFPVIQAYTAILAALFILSNILTDVLYAIVDPRVTLR
ncbi:MAG: peptide/nickel transport system permease protein [Pirellulaceae bacterium]|jgi:peptide/nickel transport system permease protein